MKQFWQKIGNTEIRNILAVMVVLGCFILLYIMLVKPIPAENKDILNVVGGMVFGGGLSVVLGFYFGASKSDTVNTKTPV